MRNYPEEIETALLKLADFNDQIADLRDELGKIEVREKMEILFARNEDGKLRYTNDAQRELALELALGAIVEYVDWKDKLRQVERQREELKAHIERLRGEFKLALLDRQDEISQRGGGIFI
ncbi:MAG: hypothetical protein AB1631_28410 [Acidobacteriota bacterium]